ncbi:hypothetical protein ACFE04_026618 [Oxalis oulophora]
MEPNLCDINHLDADVLLPPRKRLLAGFIKQTSDGNGQSSDGNGAVSQHNNLLPHPPIISFSSPASLSTSASTEKIDAHVTDLINSHMKNPNMSPEELQDVTKSIVTSANKAARAARASAEKKAVIAAKAVAKAKSALDLVSSLNEEAERLAKKNNKLKKHVPVQLLYKKHQPVESSGRTDEEIARKLHQSINSSPRISKTSLSHSRKKLKASSSNSVRIAERIAVPKGVLIVRGIAPNFEKTRVSNGHSVAESSDSEDFDTVKPVQKASKYEKVGQLEKNEGEAESSRSKEKTLEDSSTSGRKRGRVKLKKLPLSICSFKDQVNPKEKAIIRSSPLNDKNMGNPSASKVPLFSIEPTRDGVMAVEATPVWKYKAPAYVKQNKVMHS